MPCPHVPDAARLLDAYPVARKLSPCLCTYPFARRKVEEVLPVARHYSLLQFAALLGQVRIFTTQCKFRQLCLARKQAARHEIDQAVRVAGNEIDRPLLQPKRIQQLLYRCPPLSCSAYIPYMRATQHAQPEALALFANDQQIRPEAICPDHLQAPPIIWQYM